MITITNEHANVFLKQPRQDELDYVAWLWSDEDTMATVGGPVTFNEDQKLEWFQRMVQPGDGTNFYCLIYTNENQKVGEVSFHRFDEGTKTAYFNVKIAYGERSQGYGKQAVLLLLDYYFHLFGGEQMLDEVAPNNVAAKHLLIQCGFEEVPSNNDATLFAITKERFDELFSE